MSGGGRRARGATIVELMVALLIGLLVLLLSATLLAAANKGYTAQADGAGIDDAGHYALEAVERAVRQAAYVNWEREAYGVGVDAAAPARVAGLDDHTLGKAFEGIDAARPGAVNGSDVLALRFEGAGQGAGGDGSVSNCGGFGVGEADQGWSIFYVAPGTAGEPELRCKYRSADGWGADAIVAGVDSFQILYGLDTDVPPDGLANQYVNATDINRLDALLTLDGADPAARALDLHRKTYWKRVAGVKVALVLHGPQRSRTDAEAFVYTLFGAAYSAGPGAADRGARLDEADLGDALRFRERRMFSATILLRNPARGTP